jgi:hypothetical protein
VTLKGGKNGFAVDVYRQVSARLLDTGHEPRAQGVAAVEANGGILLKAIGDAPAKNIGGNAVIDQIANAVGNEMNLTEPQEDSQPAVSEGSA